MRPITTPSGAACVSACISLVGVACAGKTTLGKLLAERLDWAHVDTDRLIEAYWGKELPELVAEMGRERFLEAESEAVSRLNVKRCVVSTGGSVVYSAVASRRLVSLGPVVWVRIGLTTFLARFAAKPDRGFIAGEGMSLAQVYAERQPLYAAMADLVVDAENRSPEDCVREILDRLPPEALLAGAAAKPVSAPPASKTPETAASGETATPGAPGIKDGWANP